MKSIRGERLGGEFQKEISNIISLKVRANYPSLSAILRRINFEGKRRIYPSRAFKSYASENRTRNSFYKRREYGLR